ncbi:MAG: hypothetical protein HYX76_05130 [Acidobacteria bacterium]|nr:hypothetical protein [Acidobacteriota bacterium]
MSYSVLRVCELIFLAFKRLLQQTNARARKPQEEVSQIARQALEGHLARIRRRSIGQARWSA